MAPRAYWKGYLKLSLVSCPIALFPATSVGNRPVPGGQKQLCNVHRFAGGCPRVGDGRAISVGPLCPLCSATG
jgi:hypothetical protein